MLDEIVPFNLCWRRWDRNLRWPTRVTEAYATAADSPASLKRPGSRCTSLCLVVTDFKRGLMLGVSLFAGCFHYGHP